MTTTGQAGAGGPVRIERLTRGQTFALAAHLALHLREARRSREQPGLHFEFPGADQVLAVYAQALDQLVGTDEPEDLPWPSTRAHRTLHDGLGPKVTSRLLTWLRHGAAQGGGIHQPLQVHSWACARILKELEGIVGASTAAGR